MSGMSERLTRVIWDAPCSVQDILSSKEGEDDYGLYQIYGHHVVFGPGALLYIGKAQKQSFLTRFQQHQSWLPYESDVSVRLGRIREGDFKLQRLWNDWAGVLSDVEALTIFWHTPPYNSHHITCYKKQPLRVRNMGDRGRLLPEYSSHWDAPRPDDEDEK
jgi:hypothetical protein